MKAVRLELIRVDLPLVAPFRTSFGVETRRDVLLVRAVLAGGAAGDGVHGWGECAAGEAPFYSSEYVAGGADVIRRFIWPSLSAVPDLHPDAVGPALARIKGHRMAKAAVETAVLDAWLRVHGIPLARYLGAVRDRVRCGVSVGIMDSVPQLLEVVRGYLAEGYVRIKLKIEPGWDVEPVRAVREEFGDDVPLQVDANTAYTAADATTLAGLDPFGLLFIEQPLDERDLLGHAELARRIRTPICLDESVVSARAAADAIRLGACSVVNVKPARVGGYLQARQIHDVCSAMGVPVWCGGMLETGVGRAANLALAALPGFTLPGDTSASRRYYATDLTEEFTLAEDGTIAVPTGPGIGVEPRPELLDRIATARGWLEP